MDIEKHLALIYRDALADGNEDMILAAEYMAAQELPPTSALRQEMAQNYLKRMQAIPDDEFMTALKEVCEWIAGPAPEQGG